MVPISLRLRNFLSYGEEDRVLDFRRFRTACLSGSNGEGKSALLDAITWVLWGIARGIERPGDDDLIRAVPDADEAYVQLEFATDCGHYRVTRRLRRGGAHRVDLEVIDGDTAAEKESDPQDAINRIVGVDYRGFVSSSFILQGRADEFTRQTPSERRRILADLLGLGRYAPIEQQSRQRAQEAKSAARLRQEESVRLRDELSREPECQSALERAHADMEASATEVAECEQRRGQAQGDLEGVRTRAADKSDLRERLEGARAEQRDLEQQAEAFRARIAEHQAITAQGDEISSGCQRLLETRAEEQGHAARSREAARLEERRRALESEIDAQRLRLEVEVTALVENERRLATEVETSRAALDERQQVAADRESLVGLFPVLKRRRTQHQRDQDEATRLQERQAALTAEIEMATRRLALLTEAHAQCPVCRKPLDVAERERLVAETRAQESENQKALRSLEHALARAEGKAESSANEAAEVERRLGALGALEQRLGELRRRAEEHQQMTARLETVRATAAEAQRRLAEGDFAAEARAALAAACDQLNRVGYDRLAHESSTRLVAALVPFEQRRTELEAAQRALAADTGALKRLKRTAAGRAQEIADLSRRLAEAQDAAAALAEAERHAQQTEDALRSARDRGVRAAAQAAAAEERLAQFDAVRERLAACESETKAFEEESALYDELAQAYGADGIHADVIEVAAAEIAREADELLMRLTDGRMSVAIDAGAGSEAGSGAGLDIRVCDELGTRRYELLSEGEAFRVDFSIRLALSRVLARRAGGPLRMLVVDEGFGGQDAQGRQHLLQALRAVEPDFEKILVVTHDEPLAGTFEHRIEVTKDEQGSHFVQVDGR